MRKLLHLAIPVTRLIDAAKGYMSYCGTEDSNCTEDLEKATCKKCILLGTPITLPPNE